MALQMIDRDQRNAPRVTQSLRRGDADQKSADESRPRGYGDLVDVVPGRVGVLERAADERKQMLQMFSRRDFRHHAAEGPMALDLRRDQVRPNAAVVVQ